MKRTSTKEIRARVKELLNTTKVVSVKVRTNKLDNIIHNSVYVMTTNAIDYKLTEYYYQNGELISITGDAYIYDIEYMKKLFKD